MRNLASIALSLALWTLSAPSPVVAQGPSDPARPVRVDRVGNPVFDDQGERLEHPRERLGPEALADDPIVLPAVPAGAVEGPYSLRLDEIWRTSIWGTSIGRVGMEPADLDGDGTLELVLGSSVFGGFSANNGWMIVRHVAASDLYDIVWSSPPVPAAVSRIAVLEVGPHPAVYVGLDDGTLQIHDGPSRALLRSRRVATSAIRSILYDDADNDGDRDLVVATQNSIHLLDPTTLEERSVIPRGAGEIAIGNVDGDAAREIVLASGPILQFDGVSAVEEWSFGVFSGGAYLSLADVDSDGMDEIVAARGWGYIDVYDADLRSPKYQIDADLDIQALLTADVNRDGRPEILYGDGQWGSIYAHDGPSGTKLWEIGNPEHGTTRIAVADLDADGELEVMWGAGWTSTGPDHFYVHGIPTLAREFESPDVVGPFAAVAQGDVDDDGHDEIVAISWESDSGYDDGILHVFDAATFALEWRSSTGLFGGFAWTGVHDVEVGDVDGDGATEIVVATDRLYDGRIFVFDGRTRSLEHQFAYDRGSPMLALDLVDVDGDGDLEIVGANGAAHTGSPGTFVYILDGTTGAVIWKSVSLAFSWSGIQAIASADLDGGGRPEIVAAFDGITVVDGETRTTSRSTQRDLRAIELGDLDGDGQIEIWAGSGTGQLLRLDPATLAATVVGRICNGPVNSLVAGRSASLEGTIQFACDDDLGIFGLFERAVIWRSPAIGRSVGLADNLQVRDRDGRSVLIAGTNFGLVAFAGFGVADTDVDEDGVANHLDNCPEVANPDQRDADADGVGDLCNDAFDRDADEWADGRDVCPLVPDPAQSDSDGDGIGDACNDAFDRDGDEWADSIDNCADVANADQADGDGDVLGDVCDRYPTNPDNQAARCEEAITNETLFSAELLECRSRLPLDADGDGEADPTDACPETPPAAVVDQAGCSQRQFCESLPGTGMALALRCQASDFRNDEPLTLFPGDCRFTKLPAPNWSLIVRCSSP